MQEKQDLATTYMQAYEGDVDIGSGVVHKMLGIQYWFYYTYHDDPEAGRDHQHDWWYVWIVYDETSHEPYQTIYNFHHNVRVFLWDDARVHKENNFHPKVWCDAGGHRSLYAPGEQLVAEVSGIDLWNFLENPTLEPLYSELVQDDTPNGDEIFGLMVYALGVIKKTIAPWREPQQLGTYDDGTALNVEDDYWHRVYVWGVSDTATLDSENSEIDESVSGQSSVKVGYTGDNIYSSAESGSYWWPSSSGGIPTYLPWMPPTKTDDYSNSVYQAWMWKSSSTASESATRNWAWNEELSSP